MGKFIKNDSESSIVIRNYIENMVIQWAMVDPLSLDDYFQVCDGSAWKLGSYAKEYWENRGIYYIPNTRGYHPRTHAGGSTNDPDRADRRQLAAGTIATGGTVITFSQYHTNIIYEAFNAGRTVKIAIYASDLFGTYATYGTVSAVDKTAKTVTITGTTLATGAQSLVIIGDVVGSFQQDQFESHKHSMQGSQRANAAGNGNILEARTGATYTNTSDILLPITDGTYPVRTGAETRGKNIALLPIMWVNLPVSRLILRI